MSYWKSGIDGGEWCWCASCRVSTPPTERGQCATCGSVIVDRDPPDTGNDLTQAEAAALDRDQGADMQMELK